MQEPAIVEADDIEEFLDTMPDEAIEEKTKDQRIAEAIGRLLYRPGKTRVDVRRDGSALTATPYKVRKERSRRHNRMARASRKVNQ